MSTLVSCVIPVYNGERYLGEAIDSVLAQRHRPIEIIVADDGSDNGSAAVARSYGDPVRYLCQTTAGPAATRNLGVAAARGDVVALLDADDLWHADKLARQLAYLEEHPEVDLCLTLARLFWIDELKAEEEAYRAQAPLDIPGLPGSSLLARRRVFEAIGLFDSQLWHRDVTDWLVRATERGAVMHTLPAVLSYRRMHRSNISRRARATGQREFLRVLKGSLDRRRG
jgi:glycosyltransferase involved in cell wall biosynthesis